MSSYDEDAQKMLNYFDIRYEKKFYELISKLKITVPGNVATAGSGSTISVYIENSPTATIVKNPSGFDLSEGQLVLIFRPDFKPSINQYILFKF